MYLGQEVSRVIPGNVAIGGDNLGQVPLFAVLWCPSRAAIWAGYAPADGQELSDNMYPSAKAGILAGNVPVGTEVDWQSTPAARGKYVAVSSAGKFRLPDLNGQSAGTLGAVFLRGDGTKSAVSNGVIQLDELKSHTHNVASSTSNAAGVYDGISSRTDGLGPEISKPNKALATGGTETRPLNVTGCWVIKLFGAIVNPGSMDAAQLATDFVRLQAEFDNVPIPMISAAVKTPSVPVTLGGLISITNTANKEPVFVEHWLKCVVADVGWNVGDETQVYIYDGYSGGFTVVSQSPTLIEVRAGNSRLPYIINKTTGANGSLTLARWEYFMKYFV